MKTIYLVRHGETDWNLNGIYQGTTDVPLNNTGLAQARACADALRSVTFDRVIASDLSRARITAETIIHHSGLDVLVDERLREINFGDWEGLSFGDIETQWPGLIMEMYNHPDTVSLPNGESFQQVQDRAWQCLDEFIHANDADETLLVACHGGTIRTIICKILHLPISYAWHFSQGNTAITRFFYYGMGLEDHNILNLLNDTHHLEALGNET